MKRISIILLLINAIAVSYSQGYIRTDYMTSSGLIDGRGNEIEGEGGYSQASGGYNLPLSIKQNEKGRISMWSISLNARYGNFDNKGIDKDLCPREIINSSLNLTFLTPISEKWSMLSSIGGGVFSEPNKITWKSVLANGALIFIYHVNSNLDIGIGAGITNSYGVPIAMPMPYVNWRLNGKYEVMVQTTQGMDISGAINFSEKFTLRLVAIEMDGVSAVMEVDGKSKIFSSASIKSSIRPEFRLSNKSTLYLGLGGTWVRDISIKDRSLKSFFNSFGDSDNIPRYDVAAQFYMGYKCGF